MSKTAVLEIAGFKLGAPVDKAAMDAGCGRLRDTGLFESIGYHYAPGPKRGYILTLTLQDQTKLTDAAIDFPATDEAPLWQWLTTEYPPFNRKVPANEAAQEFLARKLAEHAKATLDGQPVATANGTDFSRGRNVVVFQLANLPHIGALQFIGHSQLTADQLSGALARLIADQGYTDRYFRQLVELNLRRVYEEHGMYRVKFPQITPQKAGTGSVNVTTSIEEGPVYKLGEVRFVGDNLPLDAIRKAADFHSGKVANWTDIQRAIWETERPVKRSGYFNAASKSDRVFHDDTLILDVNIAYNLGPLFHAGEVSFTGLTPAQEALARKLWKLKPGDPYDFLYPNDFVQPFAQAAAPAQFKKFNFTAKIQPGNVMDYVLTFEAK